MPIEDLINSVQRMDLKPSSIIVISCEQKISQQSYMHIKETFKKYLKLDNEVLVLDQGLTIQIIDRDNNKSLADILIDLLIDKYPDCSIDKEAFRKEALKALEIHTDPKIVKKDTEHG